MKHIGKASINGISTWDLMGNFDGFYSDSVGNIYGMYPLVMTNMAMV